MAAYQIYVDESGKLSTPATEYTSLCGYVGQSDEWMRVGIEWTNLRMKWQVPPIHMTRIMNPGKQQDDWFQVRQNWGSDWEEKRNLMLEDFAITIQNASVVCVGSVVDAIAYRKIKADPHCSLGERDSNVFAFQHIIMRGIEAIERVDGYSPVSIIVDDDPQNVNAYYQLLEGLRVHPDAKFEKVKRRIQGICFCKDAAYPGIQAADMVAFEARNYMRARIIEPNAMPSLLLTRLTFAGVHQPRLFTEAVLQQIGSSTYKEVQRLQSLGQTL